MEKGLNEQKNEEAMTSATQENDVNQLKRLILAEQVNSPYGIFVGGAR